MNNYSSQQNSNNNPLKCDVWHSIYNSARERTGYQIRTQKRTGTNRRSMISFFLKTSISVSLNIFNIDI